jgi:hypothetical protein
VIRARAARLVALALGFTLAAGLRPDPAIAGASLRLTDGRTLEGTDVRREGDVYVLTLPDGSVVPIPTAVVAEVGFTGTAEPERARPEPPTGLTYPEPQTLAGVPVTPPTTADQLAVFGEPAKFQQDIVRSNLEPTYWIPDPAQNNWNPSKWAKPPIDPEWHPTSAFDPSEDVLEESRSTWQKSPIDSTWVPQDAFKKR